MIAAATAPVTGVEHWTRKGDVRLFLWEKFVGVARRQAGGAVRARLVDGVAADVRPDGARTAGLVGDGLVRAARLRLLVRRHGRLRPLRQDARHLLRHRQRRRRPRRGHRLHRAARAACSSFMTYGISSGALRAALFAQRHPDRVARLALDAFVWTGEGAPTLEQRRKKLPEFLASKRRPIDRAFVPRSSSATTRIAPSSASSRRSPTRSSRSTTRCPTAPTSTCAASCRSSIRRRSRCRRIVLRGQYDGIAAFDDLIEFFKRLPQSRQAVLGDGRHLARELPAEELPDGLSHPARVLHAARRPLTSG